MPMEKNFNDFFTQHYKRVHYQIHRLGISSEWYDSFYQEGIIALWRAYDKHDATKGEIGTYLNTMIRYRLIDLLREKLRTKENTKQMIEETKTVLTDGNRHKMTEKPIIKYTSIKLEDTAFWEEVKKHLNENQWKWVKYFIITELSIKEIMELEDVTADTVKYWARSAKKKLKEKDLYQKLTSLLEEEK